MWRRAARAVFSVCIITGIANIPILRLAFPFFEKETKSTSMIAAKSFVNEASSQKYNLFPSFGVCVNFRSIDSFYCSIGAVPGAWEYNVATARLPTIYTNADIIADPLASLLIAFRGFGESERLNAIFNGRFAAGILILNAHVIRFGRNWIANRASVAWADPSSLSLYQGLIGIFRLFGRGLGGLDVGSSQISGGSRLFADGSINLYHFMDLPKYSDGRASKQNNGHPIPKRLALVFAFFFGAVGAAFCGYGVYKSREIGGWAVWIVCWDGLCFCPLAGFC